jgi:hypothetical protein
MVWAISAMANTMILNSLFFAWEIPRIVTGNVVLCMWPYVILGLWQGRGPL